MRAEVLGQVRVLPHFLSSGFRNEHEANALDVLGLEPRDARRAALRLGGYAGDGPPQSLEGPDLGICDDRNGLPGRHVRVEQLPQRRAGHPLDRTFQGLEPLLQT